VFLHRIERLSRDDTMSSRTPRQFFKPLAIGAPALLRELPVELERRDPLRAGP